MADKPPTRRSKYMDRSMDSGSASPIGPCASNSKISQPGQRTNVSCQLHKGNDTQHGIHVTPLYVTGSVTRREWTGFIISSQVLLVRWSHEGDDTTWTEYSFSFTFLTFLTPRMFSRTLSLTPRLGLSISMASPSSKSTRGNAPP